MSRESYVKEFEGLRGLLASWVVLGHALVALPVGLNDRRGSLFNVEAVTVFIVLSGFVIFSLLDGQKENSTYLQYITGRFFRIYPVYLLVVVVSALLFGFDKHAILLAPLGTATAARLHLFALVEMHPFAHFLAHLLMLQGVVPEHLLPGTSYAFLGQAWSISVEWQFYLVAPMLFVLIRSLRRWTSLVALVLIMLLCVGYGHYTTGGFAGNNCVPFAVGFASFFLFRSDFSKLSANTMRIGFIIALALSVLIPQHHLGLAVWAITFYAVLAARRTGRRNALTAILLFPPVLYVGRISFSLYMVHIQVLFALMWLFHAAGIPVAAQYVALPFGCLLAAIGVAALVHHTLESPLHVFGKQFAASLNKKPPPVLPEAAVAD